MKLVRDHDVTGLSCAICSTTTSPLARLDGPGGFAVEVVVGWTSVGEGYADIVEDDHPRARMHGETAGCILRQVETLERNLLAQTL